MHDDVTAPADPWLRLAKEAFEVSTTYLDNNYRATWENNIKHFKGQHQTGSKYYSPAYKYRSKFFRPKTRSMVRQNEAATAAAFFTNSDVLSVEPYDKKDKEQRAAAELRQGLLNHHLQNTIPWFLTLVGGMQDAEVQGVVCSKQYWEYTKRTERMKDPETGEEGNYEVIDKNKPAIRLVPIEMFRFDPAASWIDPVNSSPYTIEMIPMYVYEVKEKIAAGEYEDVDLKYFQQALVSDYDTTRQSRENRQDSQETKHSKELGDFDKVYVHENIIRRKGRDIHFYTLGTSVRLTKPRPLGEVYFHNIRPYVLGCAILEAHNSMPPAIVELTAPIQKETNEIVNSRIDNVKLVLNKRYIVKRGQQVDLQSLIRNAAGSITLANNPDSDIREMEFSDVTGSSYAEQDRLNLDMDELAGSFSNSSIQANRKMNETVGGMQMARSAAGGMTQYLINVFSETWVEKVLRQFDLLIQFYEDDIKLIMLIANEANIIAQYNVEITPLLMRLPAKVIVNVTNSATDPIIRLEQFLQAIQKYNEIAQTAAPGMDLTEIRKEIFGKLGYKNGSRFFMDEEGEEAGMIKQLQAQLQQLTQALEDQGAKAQAEQEGKIAIAQLQEQSKQAIVKFQEESKQAIELNRTNTELQLLREKAQSDYHREMMLLGKRIESDQEIAIAQHMAKMEEASLSSDTSLIVATMNDKMDERKMVPHEDQAVKQMASLEKLIEKVKATEGAGKDEVKNTIDEMKKARESNVMVIKEYLKKKQNPELNKVLERID